MRRIYKYTAEIANMDSSFTIAIPQGAEITKADLSPMLDKVTLWALVEEGAAKVNVQGRIEPTGGQIDEASEMLWETFIRPPFVWHLVLSDYVWHQVPSDY